VDRSSERKRRASVLRRFVLSRGALAAVVVVMVLGAAVGSRIIQAGIMREARSAAAETAALVAELSLSPVLQAGAGPARPLTPGETAVLNENLRSLGEDAPVLGLEVWSRQGALLYADPGHPAEETTLPPDELRRSLRGAWSQPGDGNRGHATYEVFVPYRDADSAFEAIVEVIVPQDRITAQARDSARAVQVFAAVLMVAVLGAFGLGRHLLLQRERRSVVDPVTGLPNRAGFHRAVRQAGGGRHGGQPPFDAVLMIDLDGFRAVNDTLGRQAGDALLRQAAQVLRGSVRPTDVAARVGGDEFAVLITGLADPDAAHAVGGQLLDRLRRAAYVVDGVELSVDAHIGAAPIDDENPDVGLQHAEAALSRAKHRGIPLAAFDPAADARDLRQLLLLVELREAIATDQLELHYQPKAWLRSGDLAGVEALVRWRHPEHGLLSPGLFVPLAESTRFIEPLTEWVLREAVRQAATWRDAGLLLPVAVNISPRVLLGEGLPTTVLDILADQSLPTELLELEITETAVLDDPEQAIAICRRLAAAGLRIAIDDFGAGYTSLSYLTRLPIDTLKLDRHFITDLAVNAQHAAVAESVLRLGHNLGMTVLAEGIEDDDTWRRLQRLEYDQGQGFHLARPMPATALEQWLGSRSRQTAVQAVEPANRTRRN
jgi:diguanylate cyclase (GGDEF)-like protein